MSKEDFDLATGVRPIHGPWGSCPECGAPRLRNKSLGGGRRVCKDCDTLWDARLDERPVDTVSCICFPARPSTGRDDYVVHRAGEPRLYLNRAEAVEVMKALGEWLATPATTTEEGDQSR